ncbi:hypothetical protein OH76DRAFT_1353663 [Lentinus brumalis]|uniref:MYND-type domain-containing protein n=1 Tax=Lentinus brumalis TaxID=2498619 RepID=A0A371D596_9APHY|nr:hypothetical protein OH76DRAFT_1353663 [Polyporus brumalis]
MADRRCCSYTSCEDTSLDLKCCAGCRTVRYCSSMCQRADWGCHVFDCTTGRPINTVYYLARDMRRDVVPVHYQTRVDYGFDKAERIIGAEGGNKLCRLYQGLIRHLENPLMDLRRWQKERRLVEGIKRAFETIPFQDRDTYTWFLDHQEFFDGSAVDEDTKKHQIQDSVDIMVLKAWPYTSDGSPNDTLLTVRSETARKFSKHEHECFFFFATILVQRCPEPETVMWLKFGFVAEPERELRLRYTELVSRCTFEEFRDAYTTSSIPALFAHHGIVALGSDRLFQDVMSGSPKTFKSVWHLKQHVDELAAANPHEPHLAPIPELFVICDYGYKNCQKAEDEDWKLLDDLYTQLFAKHGVDPLELHAACRRGELLQFVKGFMRLSPWTAKYARLLKNAYPLPASRA